MAYFDRMRFLKLLMVIRKRLKEREKKKKDFTLRSE